MEVQLTGEVVEEAQAQLTAITAASGTLPRGEQLVQHGYSGTLSNTWDTLGTEESVLISEVS